MLKEEFNKIKSSFYISLFFVTIMWVIKVFENSLGLDFSSFGVYPRHISGLKGIIFSPFIHGDYYHLFDNSIPLLVLGTLLFYFYRGIAWEISLLLMLVSGFWLWIIGRESYHIGASGFIYGLAAFLFVSGIVRKNLSLLTISLLVVFLYGSLIWGVFPIDAHVSWEGHLSGGVAGIILAWNYRKRGPKQPSPIVLEEPDDSDPYWLEEDDNEQPRNEIKMYKYFFRPKDEDKS
jgi:membrane associated rhomboid family serine protease